MNTKTYIAPKCKFVTICGVKDLLQVEYGGTGSGIAEGDAREWSDADYSNDDSDAGNVARHSVWED